MNQDRKQCGNCKYWESFYMAYDCDPYEPTDLGFCSISGKQDDVSNIEDVCDNWEAIETNRGIGAGELSRSSLDEVSQISIE